MGVFYRDGQDLQDDGIAAGRSCFVRFRMGGVPQLLAISAGGRFQTCPYIVWSWVVVQPFPVACAQRVAALLTFLQSPPACGSTGSPWAGYLLTMSGLPAHLINRPAHLGRVETSSCRHSVRAEPAGGVLTSLMRDDYRRALRSGQATPRVRCGAIGQTADRAWRLRGTRSGSACGMILRNPTWIWHQNDQAFACR